MEPTWGPSGADRTQLGPMLAQWTLLSGMCQNQSRMVGTQLASVWLVLSHYGRYSAPYVENIEIHEVCFDDPIVFWSNFGQYFQIVNVLKNPSFLFYRNKFFYELAKLSNTSKCQGHTSLWCRYHSFLQGKSSSQITRSTQVWTGSYDWYSGCENNEDERQRRGKRSD